MLYLKHLHYFTAVFICVFNVCLAQKNSYTVATIAFYNVENLFDTINNPNTKDDYRTPNGASKWTSKRYADKLLKISTVINNIGKAETKTSPVLIGLAEIENEFVLTDLIHTQPLKDNYGYIHFNSKDERGIDVALLYKKQYFTPIQFYKKQVNLINDKGFADHTRDILVVYGYLFNEPIYVLVNHWPSRRGGQAKSSYKREVAALETRKIIDSILHQDATASIICMGDFNDDPHNKSIKNILRAKANYKNLHDKNLYNPMAKMAKRGYGSLAYKDKWNLFDQILVSKALTNKKGFRLWKAGIYNPKKLQVSSGSYKGYPFRTYVGNLYQGGFSDHFPVYVYLIKPAQ